MHPDCTDPQGRATKQFADLNRHYKSIHERRFIDCPRPNCSRKGTNGFMRTAHLTEHLRGYHSELIPKRFSRRAEKSTTEHYAPRALSRRDTIFDADPRSKNQVGLTYSGLQDTKLKPELQDRGKAFQEASAHFGLAGHTSQNKEYQGAYFGPPEDSNQVKSATLANWVLTEDELAVRLNLLKVNQRY